MNHYRAIFFDLNGTLVNILTDEGKPETYRTLANLLSSYGAKIGEEEFRKLFFEIMTRQRKNSPEAHPEFDAAGIFESILSTRSDDYFWSLAPTVRHALPGFLAQTYRAATMLRLELYPDAMEVLRELQKEYSLAAVSDAQKIWAEAEMRRLGLTEYFPVRVISSELGVRKPGAEIFQTALDRMGVAPQEVIYVGNDTYRDVYGAKRMGMKSVYFKSNQGDQQSHGEEPDYVIYHLSELPQAVKFLEGNVS